MIDNNAAVTKDTSRDETTMTETNDAATGKGTARSDAADRADIAKAQWSKEMPGLDLEPMVLLGRLSEAAQAIINGHLVPAYAKIGLKQGEFDVLATLVRSGPPYKLMPTDLYKSMMMSSGGMTSRLDKLEKAGHIERCPHPDDRRALMVCLTDSGHRLIKGMLPTYVESQKRAVGGLTEDERATLSRLLKKLILTGNQDSRS